MMKQPAWQPYFVYLCRCNLPLPPGTNLLWRGLLAVDDSAKESRMLRTALVLVGLIMGMQNVEM